LAFAAAGGDEQRAYPWSNPPGSTAIDCSNASYGCPNNDCGDGTVGCAWTDLLPVGSKPAGNARWGHADLAGSLWEWGLDLWAEPFPSPCDNCVNLTGSSPNRLLLGGGFGSTAAMLLTTHRLNRDNPALRFGNTGVRCARDP
jgi:formylglycine-generating enzyme required for sulfatase activity